jgi:hypothetical protein
MMSSISLDEQQLATLTPEEQAAIKGDDFTQGEVDALKGIAGKSDADDGDDDAGNADEVLDANGKPVETTTTVVPAKADETKTESADDKGDVAAEPAPSKATAAPAYKAELPEDFDDQMASLKTQEDELRTKFKAGDMELDDYESQRDAIIAQRSDLDRLKVKAEISQEMTQQSAATQWRNEVDTLFAAALKPENGGIDYAKDTEKGEDLDQFVKTLAKNPANADKPMDWFLQQGHKRVLALHGVELAKPEVKEEVRKPASRTPPLAAAPKTLSQVPGGDGPGDVGSEFAHLDSLEGDALEAAIARMTPAQREKFSKGE